MLSGSGHIDSTFISTSISIRPTGGYFATPTYVKMAKYCKQYFSLSLFLMPHPPPPPLFCQRLGVNIGVTQSWRNKGCQRSREGNRPLSLNLSLSLPLSFSLGCHDNRVSTASHPCTYKFSYSHTWTLTGLRYHLRMHNHVRMLSHLLTQRQASPQITHTLTHTQIHVWLQTLNIFTATLCTHAGKSL